MHLKNKRPMGHIAHLRKQFKSINTYDYIITLIKRRKKNIIDFKRIYWFSIWTNLNPLPPRMLCAKFGWNWPSGSGEEDFLISSMYFHYFVIISPWKRAGPFMWINLNPLHPRMHCAKFGWNWLSDSGEEDFLISSMYFHYFVIISPWKRAGPFIWTNLNPLHPRMLCAKFGWYWPSISGEEDENVKSLQTDRQTDRRTDRRWRTGDQKSSLELSAQVS